jgi:hypothetical protein
MRDYFSPPAITSWDDFLEVAKDFKEKKEKWIFRGNKAGETLKSSLERAVQYYPKKLKPENKKLENKELELLLLREFKRRYHQYSLDAPKDNDYLEWFSLMQHYGAPTRLLDFTYSIYIAAYFALEHSGKKINTDIEQFEVFAVDANWAIKKSRNKFPKKDKTAKHFFADVIDNKDEDLGNFKKYFMRNSQKKEFVCPFNPFRLTERLTLQKGVFMCPGNVNKTFDANLKSLGGWNNKDHIIKYILEFDRDQIINARGHLYDLNITRATLFPGLEGFAKSLTVYPPKLLGSLKRYAKLLLSCR